MQFELLFPKDIEELAMLQPSNWSDIRAEFLFFIGTSFCNPIKLIVDNKIVGVGNTVTFKNTAWISHIIVGSSYRNRGYGSHIVEYLLNTLNKKHINSISLIASPFGEPVYKKFGFDTVANYIYLERVKPWFEQKISGRIAPYRSIFYADIIRLDKEVSGEYREPLLKQFIDSSFVYLEKDEMRGFYIPTLGEGQIFADTKEAGIELMRLKYSRVNTAVIPESNKASFNFLKQNGFSESKTTGKRMIIGKQIDWQPSKIYSRISGDYG